MRQVTTKGKHMPTYADTAHRLARKCAEQGEFVPSELLFRYRHACRVAGIDSTALLRSARKASA